MPQQRPNGARGKGDSQESAVGRRPSALGLANDKQPDEPNVARRWPTDPRIKLLRLLLGVLMTAAAVGFVIMQRDALSDAWQHIRAPSPWPLILLPLSILANIALAAVLVRLLLSRFGRVGMMEMHALIAVTTLVNFIPLRPGLPGRLLYHRAVNNIPLMQSGRTVIEAAALSVGVGGYLVLAALATMHFGVNLWLSAALPLPLLALLAIHSALRLWVLAIFVRYVEVLVWAVRYWCAFELIGTSIGADAAIALACVSVFTTMVPLFSNGLGLREWAIGFLAPLMTAATLELGLIAELVNRAVEIVIVTTTGLIGMAWLAKRAKIASKSD